MLRSCRRLEWWAHTTHRELCYFHDDAQQKHYHHLSMFSVFIILSRYNIVVTFFHWNNQSQGTTKILGASTTKLHSPITSQIIMENLPIVQKREYWIPLIHRFKMFTFHYFVSRCTMYVHTFDHFKVTSRMRAIPAVSVSGRSSTWKMFALCSNEIHV